MPHLTNQELTDVLAIAHFRSIYNVLLFKDVVARHGQRSIDFLERRAQFVADNGGRL